METIKKYWPVLAVGAVVALVMFTDKGKRVFETAKLWFK